MKRKIKKLLDKQTAIIVLSLLFSFILGACGSSDQLEPNTSNQETPEEQETDSSANETDSVDEQAETEQTENSNSDLVSATVTRTIDGDTMEVNINGKQDSVRLLLVDTPETKHPSKAVQAFGPEASEFARETLAGKRVQLEFDGPKRDKYGRLLAYLWVDDKMFNQMLLENGLARYAYVYDPPYTHSAAYIEAERKAKNAEIGIWSIADYVTDGGFNDSEPGQELQSENKNEDDKGLSFDPNGPDRDCGDFSSQPEAQRFYEAAGGPTHDPHRLDGSDNDGVVCESL